MGIAAMHIGCRDELRVAGLAGRADAKASRQKGKVEDWSQCQEGGGHRGIRRSMTSLPLQHSISFNFLIYNMTRKGALAP